MKLFRITKLSFMRQPFVNFKAISIDKARYFKYSLNTSLSMLCLFTCVAQDLLYRLYCSLSKNCFSI